MSSKQLCNFTYLFRDLPIYHLPQTAAGREALAAGIGADGQQLLQSVDAATDRPWLREVPAGDSQDSDSTNDAYYFETCRRHAQSLRICDAVVWALHQGMS